jgi:hypothetical protein
MTMNLGDGFARRKQIDAEIEKWNNRLAISGRISKRYRTKSIKGDKYDKIPGTLKEYTRNYTIEECLEKLNELIKEDRVLARRISLTNQVAKAKLIDLDKTEKELTIPELLVLRNDIAPKLENKARSIPKQSTGIETIEKSDKFLKWRSIVPRYKNKEELSDKGHKIQNEFIDYYDVEEVQDFGIPEREIFDEIDELHEWMVRIRVAINQANKTELVDL